MKFHMYIKNIELILKQFTHIFPSNGDINYGSSGGLIRRRNGDNIEQDSGLEPEMDERLKNIEPKMVELIMNEVSTTPPLYAILIDYIVHHSSVSTHHQYL